MDWWIGGLSCKLAAEFAVSVGEKPSGHEGGHAAQNQEFVSDDEGGEDHEEHGS